MDGLSGKLEMGGESHRLAGSFLPAWVSNKTVQDMNIITKSWRSLKGAEARQIADREKKHEAMKCPNCGHYELKSTRSQLITAGIAALITGAMFFVFIITIPLAIIAWILMLVFFAAAPFSKGHVCKNCKYKTAT